MDDLLSEFLSETAENIEAVDLQLVRFEEDPSDLTALDGAFRLLHTIKGTCGFLGLPRLETLAHAGEALLSRFRHGELAVTSEAVTLVLRAIDGIKHLLEHLKKHGAELDGDDKDLIAELVACSGQLEQVDAGDFADPFATEGELPAPALEAAFDTMISNTLPTAAAAVAAVSIAEGDAPSSAAKLPAREAASGKPAAEDPGAQRIRVSVEVLETLMTAVSELVLTRNQLLEIDRRLGESSYSAPLQRLSAITGELQNGVMKARMQPIGAAWKTLPRLVRDIANELGKKIELVMDGEATELDRQLLDLVKDPLSHMIRNAADHGLETPDERRAAGKPETGTLRLSARHEGSWVVIRVADDGRGLDTERIRRKATERGLVSSADAEAMSEGQVHRLIFSPGFSTVEVVTHLSGRGVGMDVVRANIEQIGGQIDLSSSAGRGMTLTIKIPLTLAIVSVLIVRAAGQRFAVPQSSVNELVRVGAKSAYVIESIGSAQMLRLRDRLLPIVGLARCTGKGGDQTSGFVMVMQVADRQFGVLVDAILNTEEIVVKPLARALEDASLFSGATIMGDGSVVLITDPNSLKELAGPEPVDAEVAVAAGAADAVGGKTPLLLVRAGPGALKAVELSRITRLEQVPRSEIESVGGRFVLQYRGRLAPVLPVEGMAIGSSPRAKQPLLILTSFNHAIALAVDQIIDVVEEAFEIELETDRLGIRGAALVAGEAVEIIDIDSYVLRGMAEYGSRLASANPQAAVA